MKTNTPAPKQLSVNQVVISLSGFCLLVAIVCHSALSPANDKPKSIPSQDKVSPIENEMVDMEVYKAIGKANCLAERKLKVLCE
jgi:hypothetical protein